jgi:DNA-binding transcriptional regulator YiaG
MIVTMTPRDLQTIRANLGWSQQRLARALGVARNTVTRWEMGSYPIPRWARAALMLLDPPRGVMPRKPGRRE